MTCDHCVRSVTAEVGALDGVSDVHVDLRHRPGPRHLRAAAARRAGPRGRRRGRLPAGLSRPPRSGGGTPSPSGARLPTPIRPRAGRHSGTGPRPPRSSAMSEPQDSSAWPPPRLNAVGGRGRRDVRCIPRATGTARYGHRRTATDSACAESRSTTPPPSGAPHDHHDRPATDTTHPRHRGPHSRSAPSTSAA